MTELLDVLPEDHPGRAAVLAQYRAHAAGSAARQGAIGFLAPAPRPLGLVPGDVRDRDVHVLDRARREQGLARSDRVRPGGAARLAVTTKVNAQGQVEGTCVGTGMGFEPAFYYHRPTHVFAAHGYGPVLLAGGEVIDLEEAPSRLQRQLGAVLPQVMLAALALTAAAAAGPTFDVRAFGAVGDGVAVDSPAINAAIDAAAAAGGGTVVPWRGRTSASRFA